MGGGHRPLHAIQFGWDMPALMDSAPKRLDARHKGDRFGWIRDEDVAIASNALARAETLAISELITSSKQSLPFSS